MATTSDAVSTALRGLMGGGLQDPPMTLQSGVLGSSPQIMAGIPSSAPTQTNALNGSSRLYTLLSKLEKLISAKYAFDVFAKDSINFGIMVTYRQTWVPQNYQVGDLVSTIPLAPKEIRRYTTRTVSKKTRAVKELEDNLQNRKTESSDTSRVDAEIVEKAQNKTNFDITATESFGGGEKTPWTVSSTQRTGGDARRTQSRSRKTFGKAC